jgi:hypothetical protein
LRVESGTAAPVGVESGELRVESGGGASGASLSEIGDGSWERVSAGVESGEWRVESGGASGA